MSTTWREQARAFLDWPRDLAEFDRAAICGAIAGKLGRMAIERTMGGPHKMTLDEMYAVFALGCRAFLAAYEAVSE